MLEKQRLPGSNLLFGLPVVLDTDNDAIKAGSKVLLTYKVRFFTTSLSSHTRHVLYNGAYANVATFLQLCA